MSAAASYILALGFILLPSVSLVNKGRTKTTHEIAYGSEVDYSVVKTSYPFMVRIILDGSFRCGGALISDRFVATARHCLEFCPCFDEANPSSDWTRCHKLCILKLRENNDFESDTETVHTIKTIYLPQNSGKPYDTSGQRTDFALVELASSANSCTQEETEQSLCWKVSPVRLPDPYIHIKEGQSVRTLGWGETEYSLDNEQSEYLAQLDITINSSTKFNFLLETNVGPQGADPCRGDSGGPLLLRGEDLEWTLVGILVGGGYECGNPGGNDTTSDWSKVALLVPWINSVMGTDNVVGTDTVVVTDNVGDTPDEDTKSIPVPVVLWHGMGDSADGMRGIESILKENIEGVYVHRIMIGGNIKIDTDSGFFGDINRHISEVCEMMANDPELENGYNAIGFSQGGQFLRAVAQRCPNPPMKILVTFGAQHQGIFGFPNCASEMVLICGTVRGLLNIGAYVKFVQDISVQAQFWHDPLHFDLYVQKSKFIAEINNEKTKKNASYAINLAKLENFVLVKFTGKPIVEPKETEHFEFYVPGQADVILPLRESPIYVEDRIGLKALDEAGKLHLLECEADHMHISSQWLIDNIIEVFFKN